MSMVRLSAEAHATLQKLATQCECSKTEVIDRAIAYFERREFFAEAHRAYAELESRRPLV